MNNKILIQLMVGLTLAALLLLGCSSSSSDDVIVVPTATLAPSPPCFGLVQVDKTPDWFGGLAFGEMHQFEGGTFTDLRDLVGCEIESGVLSVWERGTFNGAYVEDCDSFQSSDIPVQELRPESDQRWICIEPQGDGGIALTQRQG